MLIHLIGMRAIEEYYGVTILIRLPQESKFILRVSFHKIEATFTICAWRIYGLYLQTRVSLTCLTVSNEIYVVIV